MSATAETAALPLAARVLLVGAGLDLHVFDTEIKFAQIEATYDREEADR